MIAPAPSWQARSALSDWIWAPVRRIFVAEIERKRSSNLRQPFSAAAQGDFCHTVSE